MAERLIRFIEFFIVGFEKLKVHKKILRFFITALLLAGIDASGLPAMVNFAPAARFFGTYLPSFVTAIIPLNNPDGVYQTLLMAGSIIFVAWSLYEVTWTKKRNMLNTIMAIPHAVIMDFLSASISLGALALPLPKADYWWRYSTFGHTAFSGVVDWVNQPSKILPGVIQGYDLLLYITILFIAAQICIFFYDRRTRIGSRKNKFISSNVE